MEEGVKKVMKFNWVAVGTILTLVLTGCQATKSKNSFLSKVVVSGSALTDAECTFLKYPDSSTWVVVDGKGECLRYIQAKENSGIVLNGKKSSKTKQFMKIVEVGDPSAFKNIKVSFKIIEVSECSTSYTPTKISVNDKIVGKVDFRDFNVGSKVVENFPIDQGVIKKGKTILEVTAGVCNLVFDKMELGKLLLNEYN